MEIIYYNKRTEDFIRNLDGEATIRTAETILLLELFGHTLGMPDSKALGGGLFELRTNGKRRVRVIYMFKNNKAYLLHGFIKKVWRIPQKDIDYARRIQKEVDRLA